MLPASDPALRLGVRGEGWVGGAGEVGGGGGWFWHLLRLRR